MNTTHHAEHINELNHLISDQLEHYLDSHPGLPAAVVLTALGEALVNLGVQQIGHDDTIILCQQLQTAVEQARY